ncbi:hypothetical protein YC2023_066950 [Brassica napus]
MNEEFSKVLGQQIECYSNYPNADKINWINGEMSQGVARRSKSFQINGTQTKSLFK